MENVTGKICLCTPDLANSNDAFLRADGEIPFSNAAGCTSLLSCRKFQLSESKGHVTEAGRTLGLKRETEKGAHAWVYDMLKRFRRKNKVRESGSIGDFDSQT